MNSDYGIYVVEFEGDREDMRVKSTELDITNNKLNFYFNRTPVASLDKEAIKNTFCLDYAGSAMDELKDFNLEREMSSSN